MTEGWLWVLQISIDRGAAKSGLDFELSQGHVNSGMKTDETGQFANHASKICTIVLVAVFLIKL
jgi:hypothetical protein